jgi:hypothetical protein
MKAHRLCTAAVVMALPLAALIAPVGAAQAHGKPGAKSHGNYRAHHKARTIRFTAKVVRSSAKGLLLRTQAGRLLRFSASQIRVGSLRTGPNGAKHNRLQRYHTDLTISSGGVVVNILGLQPGTTVVVTETIGADGSITITITLPPGPVSDTASGVVSDVGDDSFTLVSADGTPLRMHMAPEQLSALGLEVCQTADVSYHQDGGVLIADSVTVTGTATDGDCAPTTDTNGVITAVSGDSLSIDTGEGVVTYSVDPSSGLTDGYQPGDLVDVTSTTNPDGSLQAVNISFVEEEASGSVSSVTTSLDGGSLTLLDANAGNPLTVYADPSNGVQINGRAFNGISVGDSVSVDYHQAAGRLIADTVSEQ